MERWVGKVAVVTGASVGIGRSLVEELSKKGLIVVGLARRDQTIKEYASKLDGKIHAIKCDVSKESDITDAFEWVEKNLGGVDLLINNAGVVPSGSLLDGATDAWKETLEVNVLAASICTREAVKTMRKRGDNGHIVNINSTLGHAVSLIPGFGMYSASKFALKSLSDSLRIELEAVNSSIKVTNISPGFVHTDMPRNVLKEQFKIDLPAPNESRPESFLSAKDVADAVIGVISLEPHVQVYEVTLKATGKAFRSIKPTK